IGSATPRVIQRRRCRAAYPPPHRPEAREEDMQRGLAVVESRAESLSRFLAACAQLAKLPAPKFQPVDINALLRRVVRLETRMTVALEAAPELTIRIDGDQIEQVLINLIRNAVDASLETGGGVRINCDCPAGGLDI